MGKKQLFGSILFALMVTVFCFWYGNDVDAAASVTINSGSASTKQRLVDLTIRRQDGTQEMRISNVAGFGDNPAWSIFQPQKEWTLEFGTGVKNVYIQFRDKNKNMGAIVTDSIRLESPVATHITVDIEDGATQTRKRSIVIETEYTGAVESMAISNTDSAADSMLWEPIQKQKEWILSQSGGHKVIIIRYRDINGQVLTFSRGIDYVQPEHYLEEGSLLKGQEDTVYYLGYDGRIHPFPHSAVFFSYGYSFADVIQASSAKLREYTVGMPVCMRAGTWLVKFRALPRVYAVEPGCVLRPIRSESEAYLLYGSTWSKRVVEIDAAFSSVYSVREWTDPFSDVDRDRDGVGKETEDLYGTSDTVFDYDGDRLSDGEEVYTWFSDPANVDTDKDGINDGKEVLALRSPVGPGSFDRIAKGAYEFPRGSLVNDWWNESWVQYIHEDGHAYLVSKDLTSTSFVSNRFQKSFLVRPPVAYILDKEESYIFENNHPFVNAPLHMRNGYAVPL